MPKTLAELNIIPDPANTYVNISYFYPNNEPCNNRMVVVYDALGRPVCEEKVNSERGNILVNVQDYRPGLYFVELNENGGHVLVKRLIINH